MTLSTTRFVMLTAFLMAFAAAVSAQVGGYKRIPNDDAGAAAAARFAVESHGEAIDRTVELLSVESAERQVVAGTNYRLTLSVNIQGLGEQADVTQTVTVVVFRDLKGFHHLKSWTEEEVEEEDAD